MENLQELVELSQTICWELNITQIISYKVPPKETLN